MDALVLIYILSVMQISEIACDFERFRYHMNYLSSRPSNSSMIEIRRFSVPLFVPMEEDVKLECDYDVEGQASQLYSLKWYKGSSQFYEFIPSKVRKHTTFPAQGLRQDQVIASPEGKIVTLQEVGTGATDQYRCELVAEGPPFHTSWRQGNLTVVVLPRGNPRLTGSKEFYHSHDFIILNCTPPLAKPAASVQWYINSQLINPLNALIISHYVNPAGLESITSQLTLEVHKANFKAGKLNIKCEASLAEIYLAASYLTVQEPSNTWFVSSNLYLTSGCGDVPNKEFGKNRTLFFHFLISLSFFYQFLFFYNPVVDNLLSC